MNKIMFSVVVSLQLICLGFLVSEKLSHSSDKIATPTQRVGYVDELKIRSSYSKIAMSEKDAAEFKTYLDRKNALSLKLGEICEKYKQENPSAPFNLLVIREKYPEADAIIKERDTLKEPPHPSTIIDNSKIEVAIEKVCREKGIDIVYYVAPNARAQIRQGLDLTGVVSEELVKAVKK